jgi:hypothetical protein
MADNLWTAFIADNGSNDILVASSPDGVSWNPSVPINQTSPFTPALALFAGKLYCAFITNDVDSATGVPSNRIFLCSTTDGVSWSAATYINHQSQFAPALAVWNGKLHIAFVGNSAAKELYVYYTTTPEVVGSWTASAAINHTSICAPSLAAFGPAGQTGSLYLAFVPENGGNGISVCAQPVGGAWSAPTATGHTSACAPALVVYGASPTLYLVFTGIDQQVKLSWLQSAGGWSVSVPLNQTSSAGPGAAAFGSDLRAGFIADNAGQDILLTASATPLIWPSSSSVSGQQSATAPALAVAPFACCWQLVGTHDLPLVGNVNYFLYGGAQTAPYPNLQTLKMVIEITSAIVCGNAYIPGNPGAPAPQGFDFQFNAYTPQSETANTFQQFVISFQSEYNQDGQLKPALSCSIETFGSSAFNAHIPGSDDKVPGYFPVVADNPQTLPAGYVFTMELTNDGSGNVVHAKFTAVDPNQNEYSWSFAFGAQGSVIPGGVAGPAAGPNNTFLFGANSAAPIVAFQLNVCGVNSGAFTPLTSGQGSITYSSSTLMTVDDDPPNCVLSPMGTYAVTVENTNCAFGQLPVCPSLTFTQPFFAPAPA